MSEGLFKKRIFELEEKYGEPMTRKAWDDIVFHVLDEAKKEAPKIQAVSNILTNRPEFLDITQMKDPAKFVREFYEWFEKWFGEAHEN